MKVFTQPQFLVVGLPASGKTTFIAALQNYLDADLEGKSIRMVKYSSNSEYLNKVHHKWLQFEMQNRTVQEQTSKIEASMHFEVANTHEKFTLNIPDIAGETFSQQWADRYWELGYRDIVESSNGLILFIHPSKLQSHAPIASVISELGNLIELDGKDNDDLDHAKVLSEDCEENVQLGESAVWSAEKSPTQTILVDLIQAHIDHISNPPVPISIIVSAWDVVRNGSPNILPVDWLKFNLPLLWQYLTSNFESISFEVFGISAQGGDFNNEVDVERLQSIENPADRVFVSSSDAENNNDVASPIISILNRWKAKSK